MIRKTEYRIIKEELTQKFTMKVKWILRTGLINKNNCTENNINTYTSLPTDWSDTSLNIRMENKSANISKKCYIRRQQSQDKCYYVTKKETMGKIYW